MQFSDPVNFVLENTVVASAPLLPELRLHLATAITPLWEATEATLERHNLPPPYWAFAWAGGQAVARLLLDRPEVVAGRRALDFAAGSGVGAIAAAKAGAARPVWAVEIDRFAAAAIALNAALNRVEVEVKVDDIVGRPLPGVEVVLAGDVCYERPMAERVLIWLRGLAADGATVLLGDPGRAYAPADRIERLASYTVPTSLELEDRTTRDAVVWRLLP